jgi:hypothetical protein
MIELDDVDYAPFYHLSLPKFLLSESTDVGKTLLFPNVRRDC